MKTKILLAVMTLISVSACAPQAYVRSQDLCWRGPGKNGDTFRADLAQCEMLTRTANQRDACLVTKGYGQVVCSN